MLARESNGELNTEDGKILIDYQYLLAKGKK